MDEKVQQLMATLGITEAEAKDVIECDKRIDKGEKLFELTDEQKQAEKKYRQAQRKPTVYNFSKRERKKDDEKGSLIKNLAAALETLGYTAIKITNPERQIDFTDTGGRKLRIVLSAPRK